MKQLLLLLLVFFNTTLQAKNYFISATGNDANNGLTPTTAWQTISKVNSSFSGFSAGDSVLFKRGDTFYGTIIVSKSGTSGSSIVISSYSTGAKPIITGFTTISGWTNEGGGIYSKVITSSAKTLAVTINGVQYAMGRYPDATYLTYTLPTTNTKIVKTGISATNWTGADAVIKKDDYTIDRCTITNQVVDAITYSGGSAQPGNTGFGFFIQNDLRTLTTYGEWYHNTSTGKFYMYFGAVDPTTKTVNVATINNIVSNSSYSYVNIDNLNLTGAIGDICNFSGTNNYCNVTNCTISFAGNEGIKFTSGTNSSANYNTINFCNFFGIGTDATNTTISYNTVSDIANLKGQVSNIGGYSSIYAVGNNANIHHNSIRRSGYNGLFLRYVGGITAQYNFIDSSCLLLSDGGGIYLSAPDATARLIDHNIILNTVGTSDGSASSAILACGIYMDEVTTNTIVTNNTIYASSFAGIKLHKAHNNTITDNVCYNNGSALDFEDYTSGGYIRNNSIRRNIFAAKTGTQNVVNVFTYLNEVNLFGTFDDNYYARPIADNTDFALRTASLNHVNYTLAQWQTLTSQDAHSNKSPKTITDVNDFLFSYNATSSPTVISFGGYYAEGMNGTNYSSYTLPAYSSFIGLKNGLVPGGNIPPVANAGIDQTITLPTNSVTLNGSGTDSDGTISSYLWTKVSGPSGSTITSSSSAGTTVTALVQGIYKYELKVTDNGGAIARDTMQITLNAANIPPTANAGADQAITLPTSTVSLSGSGSDVDGTIADYLWAKVSGPSSGTITSTTSATTSVTGLVQGMYYFQLQVTDNNGAIGKDTVQVTVNALVNQVPVSNAGSDKTITLPTNTTTLAGSGTDANGTISSYAWVTISGPSTGTIATSNAATTALNNLVQGVYKYELTVTDNNGAIGKDTVQVTVNAAAVTNQAPVSNAGSDKTITLPTNTTTLAGSGTDANGTISSYAWVTISGPSTGTIATSNAATTALNNLVQGVYKYELTVTDNNGSVGKDTVQMTVNVLVNQVPVSNAGSDKTITLPTNTTTLAGSGTDADGTISSYAWVTISGPSTGTIATSNAATTALNNLVQGVYKYELTVTDNNGAIGKDTVQVTVNAAAVTNQAPVSNAGSDKTITLPTNTTTLAGSGTDANSTISSYAWVTISGPSTGTIATSNAATTALNNLVQGVYKYELTVTDNNGAVGKDTVQVTVNAAAVTNKPPVANAGSDINVVLPVNSTALTGTGTDPDGTVAAYNWKVISGPAGSSISNASSANATIGNLVEGVYVVEFTVVDNNGAIAKDSLSINVSGTIAIASNSNLYTFRVYPNPVKSIAKVNISSATTKQNTNVSILVIDLSGKIVKSTSAVSFVDNTVVQLDMSALIDGYYIVQLIFGDGQKLSTKVVKIGR
jgi:parallel beta-helix repeat protein